MSAHAWMPLSPCGPSCTVAAGPIVSRPRRALRALAAAWVLLCAVLLAPLLAFTGARGRRLLCRGVCASLLRAFGIRLRLSGDTGFLDVSVPRGALAVSNHVSWLDIVAVNSVRPMPALAKSEIRDWPVIGTLAARSGTVFLRREGLRALPGTVGELAEAMRRGGTVHVNPEGTTWCGMASGRFRPAVFQAAIDGGVPVRPLALRYRLADGSGTTWPAFVGEETLIDSVRRVLRLRGLVIELRIGTEIAPGTAADRVELAWLAESAIRSVTTDVTSRQPESGFHPALP
jgi:1-acyl-sn-glycerol-3-phosphate acyltransferase